MDSGGGGLPAAFWVVYFIVIIFLLAVMWKIFAKAGQPGWAAIIPIYNMIVLLQIVNKPPLVVPPDAHPCRQLDHLLRHLHTAGKSIRS